MSTTKLQRTLLGLVVAGCSIAGVWAHNDDDIRQTAARLGYVRGDVTYNRGDDPEFWQPAEPNLPLTIGDGVYTGDDGRLELQVPGGMRIRLVPRTELTTLNLTTDTLQFAVDSGTAFVLLPRFDEDRIYEIDTPNAAITLDRSGSYRVDVDPDGFTRLQVRTGRATIASGGGQVGIGAGDAIELEGTDVPRYEVVDLPAQDSWDRWSDQRERELARVRSYQYVSADVAGVEDLDAYGRWQRIPQFGWCWSPLDVAPDWAPYRVGRWIWQDPWGWTWVSNEPWGWAPYHYGRWTLWAGRWYWVPAGPRVQVSYAPALVAFSGGGPGWSLSVGFSSGGYVGWFPLAPADPYLPWWGPTRVNVNVTNVTYVNRTYVTVVDHSTFVCARPVTNAWVRDRKIVRDVARAPVVRGQVPLLPTRQSIRVSTREVVAARPEQGRTRSVVTRVAPPPPQPRFDTKAAWIRDNRGAPVHPREAVRLAEAEGTRERGARRVRPAASESGRVVLRPRPETTRVVPPEPIVPPRSRSVATRQRPPADEAATPRGRQGRGVEPDGTAAQETPRSTRRDPPEARPGRPGSRGRSPVEQQRPEASEPGRDRGAEPEVTAAQDSPRSSRGDEPEARSGGPGSRGRSSAVPERPEASEPGRDRGAEPDETAAQESPRSPRLDEREVRPGSPGSRGRSSAAQRRPDGAEPGSTPPPRGAGESERDATQARPQEPQRDEAATARPGPPVPPRRSAAPAERQQVERVEAPAPTPAPASAPRRKAAKPKPKDPKEEEEQDQGRPQEPAKEEKDG